MPSSYKKTIILGLDYSEFQGGIAEANTQLRVLESQFGAVSESTKNFTSETEKLELQQDKLQQQIMLVTRKVELSKQALDKAKESGEASDKQLANLQIAYNNNQKQLAKLSNELEENSDRLEENKKKLEENSEELEENKKKTDRAEKSTGGFRDTILDLADTFGVEASPAVQNFVGKIEGLDGKAAAAVLMVGALVTAVSSLAESVGESANEIVNTSQTMGMTTDQYQEWDYIMQRCGYDAESMAGDLAALAEKANDASEGGNDAAEMFKELGIRVTDSSGKLKGQGELFEEIVERLQGMEDVTKRNAIASELFSTTGEKLIPILNQSKEELSAMKQQAHEVGAVMGGESLQSAQDYYYAMMEVNASLNGIKISIGKYLVPIMKELLEIFSSIPAPVWAIIAVLSALGVICTTVSSISTVFAAKQLLLSAANTTVGLSGITASNGLLPLVLTLGALVALVLLLIGKKDDLTSTISSIGKTGSEMKGTIDQANQTVNGTKHNARGTKFFQGGETWVGEEGPEIVELPSGSRIHSSRESKKMMGAVNNYYITIDAKNVEDFNKVVRLAQNQKSAVRRGVAIQ